MRRPTRSALVVLAAVLVLAGGLAAQKTESAAALLRAAMDTATVEGDLKSAIRQYQVIVDAFKTDRSVVATALVRMAECYQKLGNGEARNVYERVVREFGDQPAAAEARTRLAALIPPPSTRSNQVVRRVLQGPDIQSAVSISPDGKYLAVPDGSLKILDIATASRRVVVRGEPDGETYNAVFSPDGRRIAYGWFRYKDYRSVLQIVGLDQSAPRTIFETPESFIGYLAPMAWSSDGTQILTLIPRADRTNQVALVNASDGSVRTLKTLDWRSPTAMSFSPDDKYVAYDFSENQQSEDRDIFLLAVDGSRETPAVRGPGNDVLLGWDRRSSRLLFRSNRTGGTSAWAVEVSEGGPRREPQLISVDIGEILPVGFANGGSYYYRRQTSLSDVYVASLKPGSHEIAAEPQSIRAPAVRANSGPGWAPDGSQIAYIARRIGASPGPGSIVIRSTDTGQERAITPKLQMFRTLRWSPDARSILVAGTDLKGRPGCFVVDMEGTVTFSVFNCYAGDWSRDGTAIFAAKNGAAGEGRPIVRVDLASGTETVLVSPPIGVGHDLAVSADGNHLAFSIFEQGGVAVLKVIPASGGEAREIVRLKGPENFGSIAWTRDGTQLFVVLRNPAERRHQLARVSVSDGTLSRLKVAMNSQTQLSTDPSGGRLAFDAGESRSELWVMENFLSDTKEKGR